MDAAIVWDAIAAQYTNAADVVEIPLAKNVISNVAVGILKGSGKKDLARRFVAFLTSEAGREIFRRHGYRVEPPE